MLKVLIMASVALLSLTIACSAKVKRDIMGIEPGQTVEKASEVTIAVNAEALKGQRGSNGLPGFTFTNFLDPPELHKCYPTGGCVRGHIVVTVFSSFQTSETPAMVTARVISEYGLDADKFPILVPTRHKGDTWPTYRGEKVTKIDEVPGSPATYQLDDHTVLKLSGTVFECHVTCGLFSYMLLITDTQIVQLEQTAKDAAARQADEPPHF
jgi:hypothetical protein